LSGETASEIVPVVDGKAIRSLAVDYPVNGNDISSLFVNYLCNHGHSLTTSSEIKLGKKIKEALGYIALDPSVEITSPHEKTYEAATGDVIELGHARWILPEAIFYPSLIGKSHSSLAATIFKIIQKCDLSIRDELWRNIVVGGGNTQFANFTKRLENDLKSLIPPNVVDIKVLDNSTTDGRYVGWFGGSILGSSNQIPWISIDEYNESGPGIVSAKCP